MDIYRFPFGARARLSLSGAHRAIALWRARGGGGLRLAVVWQGGTQRGTGQDTSLTIYTQIYRTMFGMDFRRAAGERALTIRLMRLIIERI